jgi:GT2 family glycosyltransferase
MYSEDVDLCLQCGRNGYHNYYAPDSVIVHHGGGGSAQAGGSAFSNLMYSESRFHYFKRNNGAAYALTYRFFLGCLGVARIGAAALAWLFLPKPSARKQWAGTIRKWICIVGWSLGWKKARVAGS